jgi:hypothetical protein
MWHVARNTHPRGLSKYPGATARRVHCPAFVLETCKRMMKYIRNRSLHRRARFFLEGLFSTSAMSAMVLASAELIRVSIRNRC